VPSVGNPYGRVVVAEVVPPHVRCHLPIHQPSVIYQAHCLGNYLDFPWNTCNTSLMPTQEHWHHVTRPYTKRHLPIKEHRRHLPIQGYRVCSKVRTHTALGPYSRAMPRSIGPYRSTSDVTCPHTNRHLQGYLAHKNPLPLGPYCRLILGTSGGPRGVLFLL